MTTEPDGMPVDMLLRDLRRVLDAADGTRIGSDDAAKAAFGWATVDAELADVVYDSAVDEPDFVLRGSASDLRQITFKAAAADVTIEIEISGSRLVGQIVPPQAAEIHVVPAGGPTLTLTTDDFGVFQLQDLAAGATIVTASAANGSWSVRCSWTVS